MSDEDEGDEGGGSEFKWTGQLVDGYIPFGPGKASYANGDSYEGPYDDAKRNGKGKYKYKNGSLYEGYYSQNQKTGYGVMKYSDKSVYEGAWFQDKKHGAGQYTYPNKDIYKGEWKLNEKHGVGTYFFAVSMSQISPLLYALEESIGTATVDQNTYSARHLRIHFIGTWLSGKFISGHWVHRNGDVYEGGFANNRPEGKGKYMFSKNKTTIYGKFADARWIESGWKLTPASVLATTTAVQKLPPPPTFTPVMDRANQPAFVIPMKFT